MNELIQIWLNNDNVTRAYIPCLICGGPTPMLGTKLCNGCWEVESRLKSFLQCADGIQFVRDTLAEVTKGDNK